MHKNVSFTARFQTLVAGVAFQAEVECADVAELSQQCRALYAAGEAEMVAAMLCFDLARPDGKGCELLDEESEELMRTLWKSLKVGAEHFFNERLGSYDKFNNRITPADLGVVFPDGTMRIVWDAEGSATDFDTALGVLSGALGMLLKLQQSAYGQQTEAEAEEADYASVKARRIDALFAAGLWPSMDDNFELLSAQAAERITEEYCCRPAPALAKA